MQISDKLGTLSAFTGSENWYRHGLVPTVLYTDGARHVAEVAGAYWLLDQIALAQRATPSVAAEEFQLWRLLLRADASALPVCEDGNDRRLYAQSIPFTAFPAPASSCIVVIARSYCAASTSRCGWPWLGLPSPLFHKRDPVNRLKCSSRTPTSLV